MKVHRVERKLIRQLQSHHNHPCNPKEKNIQSSLKERSGVECLEIVRLLWPSQDGEGEESRREPSVEYIFVAFEDNFIARASKELFSLIVGIFFTASDNPTIIALHIRLQNSLLSLLRSKPCRNLMPPPQLTTDTPIPNIIQPLEPRLFVFHGKDLQLSIPHSIGRSFSHITAIDIPLGSNHRFKNVTGTRTETQTHFVGFFSLVQTLLLERFLNGNTGIVTHHTLELRSVVVDSSIGR
mmetsp:Transcript_4939/g.10911  ORF Transcript_4939/g.10911 Transcript_4939/m.10911 type:complete len:239 (+) Transcript_4939:1371-2087(+)